MESFKYLCIEIRAFGEDFVLSNLKLVKYFVLPRVSFLSNISSFEHEILSNVIYFELPKLEFTKIFLIFKACKMSNNLCFQNSNNIEHLFFRKSSIICRTFWAFKSKFFLHILCFRTRAFVEHCELFKL